MIVTISALSIPIVCYVFYRWQIKKIKVHCHSYSKPIASRYVSFNTRDIVYECKCGDRKIIKFHKQEDDFFPIPTNHLITHSHLEKIANRKSN